MPARRPSTPRRRRPLDDGLVREATAVLEPMAGGTLERCDVEASIHNLTDVVDLLLRWKAEDEANATQNPTAGARPSGQVPSPASKP